MDELVDILDESGNHTGKSMMKSLAHQKGLFHPTIHVWFYTLDGQVLLQKRGKKKNTFPSLWDVSVAGHIGAGEAIETSALREIKEEIGLDVGKGDLEKIGIFRSVHKHADDFVDAEFHHTFLCKLTVPLEKLIKQDSEVEALALLPLLTFAEETWGMANTGKYVPHGADYYKTIVKEVKKKL
ncbi:NUDIX domain-containing protein [Muricauda sp. SCSIO 65647]|nr:NUDIX domain-containing protein [Muricauda sp. SCSIO 65647]